MQLCTKVNSFVNNENKWQTPNLRVTSGALRMLQAKFKRHTHCSLIAIIIITYCFDNALHLSVRGLIRAK